MECGEIDFAHILAKHQGVPLGLNFIRVYWQQMLQAVQAIHEEKIVHSDLKPANFLLVAGQLKLIDFGIAKRMGDDTTNIHRDQQVQHLLSMYINKFLDWNGELHVSRGDFGYKP
jgi:serine/threonine-protein kinase TTK/MPS1